MQTYEIQPGWVLATLLTPVIWAYAHQLRNRRYKRRWRNRGADAIRRVAAGQNFATAPRQQRPGKEAIPVR